MIKSGCGIKLSRLGGCVPTDDWSCTTILKTNAEINLHFAAVQCLWISDRFPVLR
jgi:hypothetical protein